MSPRKSPRWAYFAAAVFLVSVWPAMQVDLPVTCFAKTDPLPGDLRRLVNWSEAFAHALGVAVIGLMVFVLDRPHRWRIPRMLASAYVPGMMANLLKLSVARIRPGHFDLERPVTETFAGWLPTFLGVPPGLEYGHGLQSFPSGHTATTVGLAIGLTRIYPQGRWLFACLAMLAGFQRIYGVAHYLSDTLAGAAIGFLGAALVADPRFLGRWLDRLERRLRKRVADSSDETVH